MLQGAVLIVVGAWKRHDCDPESDWSARFCLCHETVILSVAHEPDTWIQGHEVVGQLCCAFSHHELDH